MKRTKKDQPLTAMGRAKLRKLRRRGRARNWHLSRKNRPTAAQLEERAWRRMSLSQRVAWFNRQVDMALDDAFSPANLARAAGPLATLGTPTIRVRAV